LGASGLGMTTINENLNVGQAFGIEFLITFVLILVKLYKKDCLWIIKNFFL